ncbi:MAG: TonB-dependent receptor [Bacteroidales bacterium]|nr:TonB-dependent receptor [Bacteroidales bacterium]
MKKYIFFVVLFIGLVVNAQKGRIEGTIRDLSTNEPVPFAYVIIAGTTTGTTADLDGKYIITNLDPGFYQIQISSVGYKTLITEDVQVVSNKTTNIDFSIEPQQYALEQVVVKAERFVRKVETPVSVRSIGIAEIENSAGANRDIARIIQNYPGVASFPGANRNDIIIRGGASNENRYFVDDIEIPNINHFATQGASGGTNGIINSDLIRSAEFLAGSFPANKYNALSAVFDFRIIDGNSEKNRFRTAIGASEFALTADGPIGEKTTYIATVRRSYLQFLFKALGLPFLPTFNDYQFKIKHKLDNKNEITLISIGALDQMRLDTSIENPTEDQKYILNYLPVYKQWSYATGVAYKHFTDNGNWTFVASRNMLNNRQYKYQNNIELASNRIIDYVSEEHENKFRAERLIRSGDYRFLFGASFEYAKYTNETFQKYFRTGVIDTFEFNSKLDFVKYGMFGQVSRSFFNEKLTFSVGMRTDAASYSSKTSDLSRQLSPRIAVSYMFSDKWSVNGSVARYYQLPAYTILGYRDNQNVLVNKSRITYIRSDHYIVGTAFQPNRSTRFTFELFRKEYTNYPFSLVDSISYAFKPIDYGFVGNEPTNSTSRGRAYGMEFLVQSALTQNSNIVVAYTLAKSEFMDKNGRYRPTSWDNRHILNITLNNKFSNYWRTALKWRFAGGLPYTPYDIQRSSLVSAWDIQNRPYFNYNEINSRRFKAFHQLDVRVEKWFVYQKSTLRIYLDVQNLYNFKAQSLSRLTNLDQQGNKQFDPNDPSRYLLREIPSDGQGTVLPTIGIMLDF